jgi:hypothetical protein
MAWVRGGQADKNASCATPITMVPLAVSVVSSRRISPPQPLV